MCVCVNTGGPWGTRFRAARFFKNILSSKLWIAFFFLQVWFISRNNKFVVIFCDKQEIFFPNFMPFFKVKCTQDIEELWKIFKNGKNLEKKKKKRGGGSRPPFLADRTYNPYSKTPLLTLCKIKKIHTATQVLNCVLRGISLAPKIV